MIIRLQGEEDTLGLIVKQYHQNGNQMLNGVQNTRKEQKAEIVRGLMERKKDLLKTYGDSRALLAKTSKVLKENSIAHFEKNWKMRQVQIHDSLATCRDEE